MTTTTTNDARYVGRVLRALNEDGSEDAMADYRSLLAHLLINGNAEAVVGQAETADAALLARAEAADAAHLAEAQRHPYRFCPCWVCNA